MKYTSAEANKLLKKLTEQLQAKITEEDSSCIFVASVSENIETCRPEYDYDTIRAEIDGLSEKIRKVKHAINVFNSTTVVPGFGITIDEMLIFIPQMSEKKKRLALMSSKLPKERVKFPSSSNIIDYTYTNYDIKKAKADFDEVTDILSRAQLALDSVNQTVQFEMDI